MDEREELAKDMLEQVCFTASLFHVETCWHNVDRFLFLGKQE